MRLAFFLETVNRVSRLARNSGTDALLVNTSKAICYVKKSKQALGIVSRISRDRLGDITFLFILE